MAVDVTAGRPEKAPKPESVSRAASSVTGCNRPIRRLDHTFDSKSGTVRAVEAERYGALVLAERFVAADPDTSVRMLAEAFLTRGLPADAERLVRRLRFASLLASDDNDAAAEVEALVRDAASRPNGSTMSISRRPCRRIGGSSSNGSRRRRSRVPSGRAVTLDYREDGGVAAAVKLQELFGLGRDAPNRPESRAGALRAPRAERTARSGHARPAQFLGSHVPGSAKRTAREISEASLARGSMDGPADEPRRSPQTKTEITDYDSVDWEGSGRSERSRESSTTIMTGLMLQLKPPFRHVGCPSTRRRQHVLHSRRRDDRHRVRLLEEAPRAERHRALAPRLDKEAARRSGAASFPTSHPVLRP